MRCFVVLTVCLFALIPAFGAANAATPGKGTVDKSWISTSSGGDRQASFSVGKVKRLYANFVWKAPAKPGQVLRIEWHDPAGALRAVWKDKTIKDDKKGTRLYAWIGSGVVKGKLGSWTAVLMVGGTQISRSKFRVVA
jgi:hypothetical protein